MRSDEGATCEFGCRVESTAAEKQYARDDLPGGQASEVGPCSRKKFNAMDLPIEGTLTARDARLGILDCMKQLQHSKKTLDDIIRFWEKKIADIQNRCPHEHTTGNANGTGLLCNDCGSFVPLTESISG